MIGNALLLRPSAKHFIEGCLRQLYVSDPFHFLLPFFLLVQMLCSYLSKGVLSWTAIRRTFNLRS